MNSLLAPKKTKYNKYQKRSFRSSRTFHINTNIKNQSSFLIANSFFWFSARQIEAVRKTIVRITRKHKDGQLICISFPDLPLTKKPEGSRMGVGKGSTDSWITKISPGFCLFELRNFPTALAFSALKQAQYKIPGETKIIIN